MTQAVVLSTNDGVQYRFATVDGVDRIVRVVPLEQAAAAVRALSAEGAVFLAHRGRVPGSQNYKELARILTYLGVGAADVHVVTYSNWHYDADQNIQYHYENADEDFAPYMEAGR